MEVEVAERRCSSQSRGVETLWGELGFISAPLRALATSARGQRGPGVPASSTEASYGRGFVGFLGAFHMPRRYMHRFPRAGRRFHALAPLYGPQLANRLKSNRPPRVWTPLYTL